MTFMNDMEKELKALGKQEAEQDIAQGVAPLDAEDLQQRALTVLADLAFAPERLPTALCRRYVGYFVQGYRATR